MWLATCPALLFLLMGVPLLQKTGLHYDASSELACFYPCSVPVYRMSFLGHAVPVMVLQYLGAFKAWLYLPVLKYLEVTPLILRLPFLLFGSASVWLFFAILNRVSGRRAAIIGALLLATDVSFLVATSYDFGPIAMLHLFFLAGIFLLIRFDETKRSIYLGLAFLLFGLAFWHKALFVWMFGGLIAGSFAAFPRRVLQYATPRHIGVAAGSLLLGAMPLVYYNLVTGGATLHTSNVMSGAAPVAQKVLVLKKTVEGSVLFGWLTEDGSPETSVAPTSLSGRLSVALSRVAGERRSNWMLYALGFSLCLVPWLWFTRSRAAAVFATVYLLAAWAQMAILPNTGASMHHVILLWPVPHFLIAIAFSELYSHANRAGARILAAGVVGVVAVNLLVVNNFYTDLVTRGTTTLWTDAVYPLSQYLDSINAANVVTVDWGYSTTLCLLSDGEMPIRDVSFSLLNPSTDDATGIRSLMSQPGSLFVDHTSDGEQFPGVRGRLSEIAAQAGYAKEIVDVIYDRNSRPRFEISRYVTGR